MKGERFLIRSIFLLLVFISSNSYTICQQYLNNHISDKVCFDFQSDLEEEISDLGDFEQDDKHPGRTVDQNWYKKKSFINREHDHLISLVSHTITTPPPELFLF